MSEIIKESQVEDQEQGKEKPKKTVWIIEDDVNVAMSLETYLNLSIEGLIVRIFSSGEDALEALEREKSPDVFIVDGNLGSSKMRGRDVVSEIGERGRSSLIVAHSSDRKDNELMVENAKKLGIRAITFEKGSSNYKLSYLTNEIESLEK